MPRSDSPQLPGIIQRVRPVPLGLGIAALLVLLTALFSRDAIHDASNYEPLTEVTLHKPIGYVLLAPISAVLDTMTLFSVNQHIAFAVTVIVCYALWWWKVGRKTLLHIKPSRRWLREVARLGVGLVLLFMLYVAITLIPRPMAQLERTPGILAIDFHAHTQYSHDGRDGWTAEHVRNWHTATGFDVAYITDHRGYEGARQGWSNNKQNAGENTLLLPGIEVVWRGERVNVLDADRMYNGLFTPDLRDMDEAALAISSKLPNNEPVLIGTIPGKPYNMIAASGPGTQGIRAIEVIDGSPKGLGQGRRERAQILKLADSTNLALVAGSDSHGYGYAATGWTLMALQDWRAFSPEELTVQISRIIRGGGRRSTRVVERYVANTDDPIALPFTVPVTIWGMLRTLNLEERIAWLVWLGALFVAWRLRDKRAQRRLVAA